MNIAENMEDARIGAVYISKICDRVRFFLIFADKIEKSRRWAGYDYDGIRKQS